MLCQELNCDLVHILTIKIVDCSYLLLYNINIKEENFNSRIAFNFETVPY